jgi:hypothetical protein
MSAMATSTAAGSAANLAGDVVISVSGLRKALRPARGRTRQQVRRGEIFAFLG